MNNKLRIYLAGGWFNENQLKAIEQLENVLDNRADVIVFNPRRENLATSDDPGEKLQQIFQGNLDAILNSDLIIASTVDKDMGTIFECGYAYGANIPILYFNPYLINTENFNLMLARSGIGLCITASQVEEFLNNGNIEKYTGPIE